MRVTQNTTFNNLRRQMLANSGSLMQAQEVASTQKKINRLSDNPIDGSHALSLTGAVSRSDQYLKNIDRLSGLAGIQDNTLGQVHDMLARAKELLIGEANQATSSAATREAARLEIANLTTQLVQAANTRYNGQYIFSGFATGTPAYSDAAIAVAPPSIAGRAAVSSQKVEDPAQLNFDTYQVQFTAAGQFDIIDTTSGATIAANQAYTSGASIRFGGLAVTLTDTPGAPQAGDIYTITSTPPGTYQGDSQTRMVDVQPGTSVAQNVPGNRIFSGAGIAGGVDVFSILNQVNGALRANDTASINSLLDQLDGAATQISNERTNVGSRVNLLDTVKARQEDVQTSLQTLRSGLEDADIAEAMTNLSKQQTAYEATLMSASKIVQPSLLDFLR